MLIAASCHSVPPPPPQCEPGPARAASASTIAPEPAFEAVQQLTIVQNLLGEYQSTHHGFPAGTTGLTPSAPCCKSRGGLCPPSPAEWRGVWSTIGFSITMPQRFQYTYDGTAEACDVVATGDLDCDGTSMSIVLHCDATLGAPVCQLVTPQSLF